MNVISDCILICLYAISTLVANVLFVCLVRDLCETNFLCEIGTAEL